MIIILNFFIIKIIKTNPEMILRFSYFYFGLAFEEKY